MIVQALARRNKFHFGRMKSCPISNLAQHAGKFVKHVVPAAVKPVHSLWHEVIGFVFLAFAGIAAWKVARNADTHGLRLQLVIIVPFIVVTGLLTAFPPS